MSDLFDLPFELEDEDMDRQRPRSGPRAPESDQPALAGQPPQPRPEADGRRPDTPRRVLTVTELTVRVRDLIETAFYEVWVEGELSNCFVSNTGHLYFTLKDGNTQIRGVIFRTALRYLKFKPADGLRVVARGRVSVYEPKG